MPEFRVNIDRSQKSMIFNASRRQAAAKRMVIKANDLLAEETKKRIVFHLQRVIRNPTPYYWTRIVVNRAVQARTVSDSRVVYGGWLEGVSRRNRTTRFKGYHTFRLIKQQINKEKARIARPAVNQFIKELRG
jgi:hypothetical protein